MVIVVAGVAIQAEDPGPGPGQMNENVDQEEDLHPGHAVHLAKGTADVRNTLWEKSSNINNRTSTVAV